MALREILVGKCNCWSIRHDEVLYFIDQTHITTLFSWHASDVNIKAVSVGTNDSSMPHHVKQCWLEAKSQNTEASQSVKLAVEHSETAWTLRTLIISSKFEFRLTVTSVVNLGDLV